MTITEPAVRSRSTGVLPSPDFSGPKRCIAGLRPYRRDTYRLEAERVAGKLVVHNYGHGGSGITMSWGCAHEVLDIVNGSDIAPKTPVAVLGSGVMGLTAATLLREAGYQPTLYAKDFPPHTTSDVAGGQWAPSLVAFEQSTAGTEKFHRILRRSFRAHEARLGSGFGVSRRLNYTQRRAPSFDKVPRDIIPEPVEYKRLPFEHFTTSGFSYETLLIEPPIFIPRLHADLAANGVRFVQREFIKEAEVASLPEAVVVNCTGLGSRRIWGDPKLVSIKGQLSLLQPQPKLQYLFSSFGYVFPRQDCVVLGGSIEDGVDDPTPDPKMCDDIVAHLRALFEGRGLRNLVPSVYKIMLPTWFIRDK